MLYPKHRTNLVLLSTPVSAPFSGMVHATSFTISDGETVTTTQTLTASETGAIESGGQLTTTNIRAIDIACDNVSVTNNGSLSCTGGLNVHGIFHQVLLAFKYHNISCGIAFNIHQSNFYHG